MSKSYSPGTTGVGPFASGDLYASAMKDAASSSGGGGGGYKSQFGELAKMWNDSQAALSRGGGGGDFQQGSPLAGASGGHSVTPIGNKGKSFLMQYINPTATVIPGGPPKQSGGGFGLKDAIGLGLSAASVFCDMRLKTDIAPLESTEVNDALAEVAFFVKGLRECA